MRSVTDITVAIVSAGNMGAAVGARLVSHGVRVVTPQGRSAASERRATDAGILIVEESELRHSDFVFSIVPPDIAVDNARRLASIVGSGRRPLYIDWNAIGIDTVREIESIVVAAGGRFADGSIIGLPPVDDAPGPKLYASGPEAHDLSKIDNRGIRFRVMNGEVGAASALKLSYAGITKGLIALGSAMFLAAERAGCDAALLKELEASQPGLASSFQKSIPDMFSKARRWVPELQEIEEFVGRNRAESAIYAAMANFYDDLAKDYEGEMDEISRLRAMTVDR
jgi:L-threonate 2-dehydrogenase